MDFFRFKIKGLSTFFYWFVNKFGFAIILILNPLKRVCVVEDAMDKLIRSLFEIIDTLRAEIVEL